MNENLSQEKTFGLRDLLRIADYRYLWLGQVISDFGDSMTNLALLLLVNHLTSSTAALATMAILLALPSLTVGLLAGVIVDRNDRKRLMILSDFLRGIFVLGFILVDTPNKLWILYGLGYIQSSIATLFNPSRNALIPNLIPQEALLPANSISQLSRIIFGILGTGLAGFIIGQYKEYWQIFAIDALTFFVSMLLISRIRRGHHADPNKAPISVPLIFKELGEGLKLTFTNHILFGAIVAFAVTMLGLGAINILLVPLIVNDLKISETWFAAFEFSQMIGLVLAGSLVAVLAPRLKPTSILTLGIILLGLNVVALSMVAEVWHIMIFLFLSGVFIAPVQASGSTIIQTFVPDDVRGRTSSANNAVITSSQLVSIGFAGVLAEMLGVRTVFVLGGILVSLAGFAAWMIFRGVISETSSEQPVSTQEIFMKELKH